VYWNVLAIRTAFVEPSEPVGWIPGMSKRAIPNV